MTLTALQRLARLERQVAALGGGSEALTPNYLTVNADGTVGADFTGRVHAQGLDLDAVAIATDSDKIRWLRTTDGALVTEIKATDSGVRAAQLRTIGDGTNQATTSLEVDDANGNQAAVEAIVNPGNPSTVHALADAHAVTVIDGNGASDFAKHNIAPSPTAPTLAGTWANLALNYTAGYWRDELGYVHLRGGVGGGAAASTIFTLPVGFRPSAPVRFPIVTDTGYGFVQVNAAGTVVHGAGGTTNVYLDPIVFYPA
jgi:hypothetical protein